VLNPRRKRCLELNAYAPPTFAPGLGAPLPHLRRDSLTDRFRYTGFGGKAILRVDGPFGAPAEAVFEYEQVREYTMALYIAMALVLLL
jgi:hypothetical protein